MKKTTLRPRSLPSAVTPSLLPLARALLLLLVWALLLPLAWALLLSLAWALLLPLAWVLLLPLGWAQLLLPVMPSPSSGCVKQRPRSQPSAATPATHGALIVVGLREETPAVAAVRRHAVAAAATRSALAVAELRDKEAPQLVVHGVGRSAHKTQSERVGWYALLASDCFCRCAWG
ncbi:hypothetical protein K438DRAFT_1952357 [Mycena galopus ATCC 62051]|nr:hypothetical protein K438DRAFT_1952357 [Mycena galopus ATCC 62051]